MTGYTTEPRFDADAELGVDAEFEPDPSLARGTHNGGDRQSIIGLLRSLTTEGRDLLSLELALAKTEMREKLEVYERNALGLAIGGGLLLAALLLGAWTVNAALTSVLANFMGIGIAIWLSPLILTLIFGAFGWSKVRKGLKGMRSESLKPTKTIETLKEDKRWAERKVHS
ncbi:MAG TPA: phage holin family protein [Longimicrobiales bacterium]|nr:phage holin family protein [Longimicrobiales bacterium]